MRITVVRLRRAILILGGLLVVILISFLAYAHYRLRRFERDLPAHLGVNIQQTANGYTYSQSSGGHTLFTIHASKLIQFRRGGNAALHDVSITLYGPPGSKRTDRIYGANFDYDARTQIVRADGKVEIDLQGFGAGASGANAIHVETSGLIFNQKTGVADTSQPTKFAFPKASGSATGAHYDSRTGVLVLDSQVRLQTLAGARAVTVQASHAVLVRSSDQALLTDPQTLYHGEHGSADSAVVEFRPDGTAQTIRAHGHVRMTALNGAVVTASNSTTQFDAEGQPTRTGLDGGVAFVSETPGETMRGASESAMLFYGPDSSLRHAQFQHNVRYAEEVFASRKQSRVIATRHMQASSLDVNFVPSTGNRRTVAQTALATGNASLELDSTPLKGAPQRTTIRADKLLARFTPDGRAVRQLNGTGNTKLVDLSANGSTNTGTGGRLQITFRPTAANTKQAGAMQIASAVQDGHVILTETAKSKPGAAASATTTAWAGRAAYDASTQVMQLTGSPRLDDGESLQLAAARIDFNRGNGDAAAFGDVKATYTQNKAALTPSAPTLNGEGPVHITAAHALLRHATGTSVFYGSGPADARMWQGGDAILAPVIELTRSPETLRAHGSPGSRKAAVEAVLTSTDGANRQSGTVQVRSRTLVYSEAARRGDFHGDVTARNADGVIRAEQAQIYLTPAPRERSRTRSSAQSRLDRIVATGRVVLTQPGRTGAGSKLVYTAANGRYVLTGTRATPPRITDAERGTTTGAALIFNSRNDSVLVSGGSSSAVTTTHAPR